MHAVDVASFSRGLSVTDDGPVLTFFVPGEPVPKGRPRARSRGDYVQIYTDSKTSSWERHIGDYLMLQRGRMVGVQFPISQRIACEMAFLIPRPKSVPKKVEYPVKSRTDVDNYAKAVLDGLQKGGILANDNIVTDLYAAKRYAEDIPGVWVRLAVL